MIKISNLVSNLFVFLLLISVSSVALALENVTVQLRWRNQFQFAGYYAALHKGFYKDAGLEVTLKEGGPGISAIDEVLQGRSDFGVSTSGLVKSFLDGNPVLMLAPIFQHSPEVLLTLGMNLSNPAEIARAGAIGLQPGDESLDLKAMFVNEGISLDKLEINTKGEGLDALLSGKIVAMNAYLSNEPFWLQKRGIPYGVIKPSHYGMDFYSDVLFTSLSLEKAKPKVVADFRKATLKGWEYALEHQDEIIGLILSSYNTQGKSRELLEFEAKTLANLISADLIQIGHSNPWRWQHIAESYVKSGVLKPDFNLDGFFYDPNPSPPDMTWLYRALAFSLIVVIFVASIAFYILHINRKLRAVQKQNLLIQESLQLANTNIIRAMEEQHQFNDMLIHELKTPISIVSMTLHQMAGKETLKQRAAQALEDMNDIVDRCRQVDQLDQQQIILQIQPCHIDQILSEFVLSNSESSRLSITMDSLPELNSDPQLLRVIFGNLINNAIKYSSPESTVYIGANTIAHNGKQCIQIAVQNLPGAAGFPDPQKVFNKYYRSPGAHSKTGSGLGLYLVQSFVTLLGGEIAYESAQDKVEFRLWIPC